MFQAGDLVTVQQIGERFGSSRSCTYRDIGFLKGRGFIEEADSRGSFRLGPAIERLANSVSRRNLADVARPHLRHLAEMSRESVLLCRRSGTRVMMLAYVDSPQMLRVSMHAADNQALHSGSFAKLLLAYQNPAATERALIQPLRGAKPRAGVATLRYELKRIRDRGYAVSDSEVESGTRSLSVPVRTTEGDVLAALTVAAPASRFEWRRIRVLLPMMRRVANDITEDWAYVSPAQNPVLQNNAVDGSTAQLRSR